MEGLPGLPGGIVTVILFRYSDAERPVDGGGGGRMGGSGVDRPVRM
jgi:hypothetical protein